MEEQEREYLMLQAIVDATSRTVMRINKEPQNPAPDLKEFLSVKQHEGWGLAGVAPSGSHLLMILKRPLS